MPLFTCSHANLIRAISDSRDDPARSFTGRESRRSGSGESGCSSIGESGRTGSGKSCRTGTAGTAGWKPSRGGTCCSGRYHYRHIKSCSRRSEPSRRRRGGNHRLGRK